MSQQEDLIGQLAVAQGQVTPLQLFDAYQEHARQGGRVHLLQVLVLQKALTPADAASLRGFGGFRTLALAESGRRRAVDVFTALCALEAGMVPADTLRGGLNKLSQLGLAAESTLPDVLVGAGWIAEDRGHGLRDLQNAQLVTCPKCRWVLRAQGAEAAPPQCPRCKNAVVQWVPPPLQPLAPQSASPTGRPATAAGPQPAPAAARPGPAAQPQDATIADRPAVADVAVNDATLVELTPAAAPQATVADQPVTHVGADLEATIPDAPPRAAVDLEATIPDAPPRAAVDLEATIPDAPATPLVVTPQDATVAEFVPPPAAPGDSDFQASATLPEVLPPPADSTGPRVAAPALGRMPIGLTPPAPQDGSMTLPDEAAVDMGSVRVTPSPVPAIERSTTGAPGSNPAVTPLPAHTGLSGGGPSRVTPSPDRSAGGIARSQPAPARSFPKPPVSSAGPSDSATHPPGSKSEVEATRGPEVRKPGHMTVRGITPDMLSQIKSTGKIFGDYYLLEKLGQGGMGSVYKGYDTKFNRFVAIKLLQAQAGEDDPMISRFYREGRAAAKLRHPNICPVFDIGNIGTTYFMAMDYCAGSSLDKEIRSAEVRLYPKGDKPTDGRNAGLEIKTALKILRDISSAVDLAHQNNIIHRDLKPANILVAPDGNCQLTDFGLAKDLTESNVRLTKDGITLGTPLYMSPEQGAGETDKIDNLSDIYSLGCIAYEMLTGRPPFEGNDTMSVIVKHMHMEPTPLRNLVPTLDPQIETVVMKCLEKERLRRYQTAKELAEDFDCILRGEPIRATAPSAMHKLRRWSRRHSGLVMWSALACATLAILAGSWVYTARLAEEEEARRIAGEAQAKLDQGKARLNEARTLVGEAWMARRQGKVLTVPELVGEAEVKLAEALKLDPSLLDAFVVRAEAHRAVGRLDEAQTALEEVFTREATHSRGRFLGGALELDRYCRELAADREGQLTLPRLVLGKPMTTAELDALLSPTTAESRRETLGAMRTRAVEHLGRVPTGEQAEADLSRGLALLLKDPATQADTARPILEESARKQDKLDEAWLGLALAAQWRGDELAALDSYQRLAQLDQSRAEVLRERIYLAVVAALRPTSGGDSLMAVLRSALADLSQLQAAEPKASAWIALRPWFKYRIAVSGRIVPAEARPILEEAQAELRTLDESPDGPRGAERHFLEAKILSELARVEIELKTEPIATLEDAIAAYGKGLALGSHPDYLEARADTSVRLAQELRQRDQDARAPLQSAIADFSSLIDAVGSADPANYRLRRGSAWLSLAEVINRRKEDPLSAFEQAAADLSVALDKNPNELPTLRLRIRAYSGMSGKYGLAKRREEKLKYARLNEADCLRSLTALPDDGELHQLLGNSQAVIATDEDTSSEDRSKYFIAAEKSYQKAIELKFILAWHDLAMLYLAIGDEGSALKALRMMQASLPKPSPELEDEITRLQSDAGILLKQDLDEAKLLATKGDYEKAEEKYASGLKKLIRFLGGLSEEEVIQALERYSGNLASSSYDLACIYAQASIGKSGGGKDRTKKPTPEESKAYVEKCFEMLAQARKYHYGEMLGKSGKPVKDVRIVEAARKDTDLEPIRKDARWSKFLSELDALPADR